MLRIKIAAGANRSRIALHVRLLQNGATPCGSAEIELKVYNTGTWPVV
jgi:hypothetical protein